MHKAPHLLAPSILSADFGHLDKAIDLINESEADWFHVDVMDGRFVPNISFGFPVMEALQRRAEKPLDVHLMIEEPERYLESFAQAGADLLCVETCQDILQAKAALYGIFDYFESARRRVPIIASVTIDGTGTMLLGTEISAALVSLEPYDIDVIGMNCATGPKEMSEHVRVLSASCTGRSWYPMSSAPTCLWPSPSSVWLIPGGRGATFESRSW